MTHDPVAMSASPTPDDPEAGTTSPPSRSSPSPSPSPLSTGSTSEVDLARAVVGWLEDQHWDVYQEVRVGPRGRIADIIAVRGPVTWVIECKRSLGFDVIAQANDWPALRRSIAIFAPRHQRRPQTGLAAVRRAARHEPRTLADGAAAALAGDGPAEMPEDGTPARGSPPLSAPPASRLRPRATFPARRTTSREFALDVCRVYGVGIIEVGPSGRVHERLPAPVLRGFRRSAATIRRHLTAEHKRRAPAGSVGGADRWSPFRQTMEQVRAILVDAGPAGLTLAEIMQRLARQHHWNTERSARMALAQALHEWAPWCEVLLTSETTVPDGADSANRRGVVESPATRRRRALPRYRLSAAGAGSDDAPLRATSQDPVASGGLFPVRDVESPGSSAGSSAQACEGSGLPLSPERAPRPPTDGGV